MGSGRGKTRRGQTRNAVLTPRAVPAREWYEADVDGVPEINDDQFARCEQRMNQVIEKFLARHPDWQQLVDRCHWYFDASDVDPEEFGYAIAESIDPIQAAVVVYVQAAEESPDEHLMFLFAHELTHVELGHIGDGIKEAEDDTTSRIILRAIEPLVSDRLTARGVTVPADFPFEILDGARAIGFDLCGLTRREIWDMLDGRMSRAKLRSLAEERGGQVMPDTNWNEEILHPSAAALAFWEKRVGPWQPEWTAAHDTLVTERSRVQR